MSRRPLVSVLRWCSIAAVVATSAAAPMPAGAQEDAFDPAGFDIGLEEFATGFEAVTTISVAPGQDDRLYVLEQTGTIQIVEAGSILDAPFLDISGQVGSEGSEQGLLGLAFAPNYEESGLLYVNYTDLDGNTVVSRFAVGADADAADPESEEVILQQEQPFPNHNGGAVEFGPDNYLYISFGDGGSQGDPNGNGQSLGTWLGKVLRIEVDPEQLAEGERYAVPEDNPFVDDAEAMSEIWAYGMRNPWRITFDRETGDLWIGDVGQGEIEEIDRLPAGEGGQNLGWNITEGTACYENPDCDQTGLMPPVSEYTHEEGGCSVTGGYVYRGDDVPDLTGVYLYADFCTGLIWATGQDADGEWVTSDPIETDMQIPTFGQDATGEIYVADRGSGAIYIVAAPL